MRTAQVGLAHQGNRGTELDTGHSDRLTNHCAQVKPVAVHSWWLLWLEHVVVYEEQS